ncbi:dynamin family protein [Calothrix sp. PCC 7507]|uniref:dynamin family protein n=1 Tax=Calothrix sp. PCC 7507 TaxID=99598 RepID=UPI00029ECF79|nr:dynamin family protein [Calothrix sp. PCC 7507]AFY35726.1 Dynamin family protein [Calothrix sp. PCC 7507]
MQVAADYKQVLLTLVGNLQQLRNYSEKLHLQKQIQLIDRVISRIETDSFAIAVVGEFKRGKSTFINALLGKEILPADVLPTTATLNRVTYGSEPFVKIIFEDDEEREIDINRLISFVTKLTPECEAVAATVKEAVIYYPVKYCRDHVEIIDTPGLSDDETMTAVTLAVLERVEVAIMVTSALAPFAESEGNFICQNLLANSLGCIIFVVNGIDHFHRPQDADKVVKKVEKRIKDFVEDWAKQQFSEDSSEYKFYLRKIGNFKAFGVSAYQALSGKLNNNKTLIEQSQFPEFESALQQIVAQERGGIFLQVAANQVIAVATEVINTINNQQKYSLLQQENFTDKYNKIHNLITNFQKVKSQKKSHFDTIENNIKSQASLLINQLENKLKQAAEKSIEATNINSSQDINTLLKQFATQVDNALQQASQNIAQQIQAVTYQELSTAAQQASTLIEITSEIIQTVDMHLNQFDSNVVVIGNSGTINNSLNQALHEFNQEQLGNLSGLFPSNLEAFLLKIEANGIYTIAGGVAGALFGPWGIPIGAAVGVGIGNSQKMKNFKPNYKSKVFVEIEKQLQSHNPNQIVNDYVYAACKTVAKLKNKIDQEISSWIEETQNTLAKLQGKQQALAETEQQTLNAMQSETQNILHHAWVVTEQIYATMQIAQENDLGTKICSNCSHGNALNCRFCIKCGTPLS